MPECRHEGCLKVCKSIAGLTTHEKRMQRVAEERMRFESDRCGMRMETVATRENHRRTCFGGGQEIGNRRECENVGMVSKEN